MTATTIKFMSTTYALATAVGLAAGVKIVEDMKGPELLELYNVVGSNMGRKRVNKFADHPTAVKRTWGILQDFAAAPDEGTAPSTPTPTPTPTPAPADKPKRVGKKRGMRFVFPAESEQKAVRPETARGKALALLLREKGATFEQVQKATGWNEKQAYEGIRLIHYYSGYGLAQDVVDGKTFIRAHTGKK